MPAVSHPQLLAEIAACQKQVDAYILQPRFHAGFAPEHLRNAIYAYLERPAKRLRPAVLIFACGATGGQEDTVIPAAAAVEVCHTWTLVHDDIIDNDRLRRGHPTVHVQAAEWARTQWAYDEAAARRYGRDIGILTGDVQHGWAVSMFLECCRNGRIGSDVVVELLHHMESSVVPRLIAGETLDVQFSRRPVDSLTESEVLEMLYLKTGVLYGFAGLAGACLGANAVPDSCAISQAISRFAAGCGTAFQLQDDILGVVGLEAKLGKPVGADLREGKRTIILLHALRHAKEEQRRLLDTVVGNHDAAPEDIAKATRLLLDLGSVDFTRRLAEERLRNAIAELEPVPDSFRKSCLLAWADYMIHRES
ncbi:MAG: hypothetical protein A3K18_30570 [Lentisphaerae bacterium RIFOXYA12_64_32]|nr:MAG: hypothetical protein A3K18_30570 [Lentisphaerae bacterium RIFOXYA12_64_32]